SFVLANNKLLFGPLKSNVISWISFVVSHLTPLFFSNAKSKNWIFPEFENASLLPFLERNEIGSVPTLKLFFSSPSRLNKLIFLIQKKKKNQISNNEKKEIIFGKFNK